jgi:Lrp/AsnC family leucine-responsive transcriptional regulator
MRDARGRDYRDGVEEIDRKILSLLAGDGRMSFTDLARQTGLSVSATHQRVRRLERRGLIRGYAAVINPAEANYILKVRVASPADLENLLSEIRGAANVSTRTTIVLSTPYENRPPDL